jgi:hypothetical protein
MKRSEINALIKDALVFFDEKQFRLPPWARWSIEEWKENKEQCTEIRQNLLGWDLTDFGSGNYEDTGLLLFTIRNGKKNVDHKTYAEKIMIVDEDQVTPMHFHWSKMEDIINRGGGNLMMQLYVSDENEEYSQEEFEVKMDGVTRRCKPGEVLRLTPGESITLYPGLYHKFYGESGKGRVLVGEVSAVNDDHTDNRFHFEIGRFPEIQEDVPPEYLLVNDYQTYL